MTVVLVYLISSLAGNGCALQNTSSLWCTGHRAPLHQIVLWVGGHAVSIVYTAKRASKELQGYDGSILSPETTVGVRMKASRHLGMEQRWQKFNKGPMGRYIMKAHATFATVKRFGGCRRKTFRQDGYIRMVGCVDRVSWSKRW